MPPKFRNGNKNVGGEGGGGQKVVSSSNNNRTTAVIVVLTVKGRKSLKISTLLCSKRWGGISLLAFDGFIRPFQPRH